jgi:hypothetical protein
MVSAEDHRVRYARNERTFCLVWLPAPGHSVMMSSFASVLVANANATPEKVVPCSVKISE